MSPLAPASHSFPHSSLLSVKLRTVCLSLGLGLLAVAGSLQAAPIRFFNDPGDTLLMDDGVTSLTSGFTFEFGTFAAGFTPTTNNVTDWTANWKPFAHAVSPGINGWNASISYFDKTGNLQLNGQSDQGLSADIFSQGDLAYLWVYNVFSITPGGQWALVTNDSTDGTPGDDWLLPSPSDPLGWEYPLINASNPIWGGLHSVQGGGDFTAPLAAFDLQTHVVPEPGSVVLIMLAGIAWRVKRARQMS